MRAINKARKVIAADPDSAAAKTLGDLVLALETGGSFPIGNIYELDYKHYELALEIISSWRLERYFTSKIRLIDMAFHARELHAH
jgi:hypothetical protein